MPSLWLRLPNWLEALSLGASCRSDIAYFVLRAVEPQGIRLIGRKDGRLVPLCNIAAIELFQHGSQVTGQTRHLLLHVKTQKGVDVYALVGCLPSEAEAFIDAVAVAMVHLGGRPAIGPFLSLVDPVVTRVLNRVVLWVAPSVLLMWLALGAHLPLVEVCYRGDTDP